MITFMEFLREEDDFDFAEFLHRECQPYIEAAKGAGLAMRGISQAGPVINSFNTPSGRYPTQIHYMKVRKDRKSLSTPEVYHHAIEGWMKDKFGISGRKGSVFVVGERSQAALADYGSEYIVIPRGEFRFVWSQKVVDLYDTMLMEFGVAFKNGNEKMAPPSDVVEYMDDLDYRDDDFPGALASGNEIMIECDAYYAIPYRDDVADYLNELMK